MLVTNKFIFIVIGFKIVDCHLKINYPCSHMNHIFVLKDYIYSINESQTYCKLFIFSNLLMSEKKKAFIIWRNI